MTKHFAHYSPNAQQSLPLSVRNHIDLQRTRHLIERINPRVSTLRQGFVQVLTAKPCFLGNVAHAFGTRNHTKGILKAFNAVFLKHDAQIFIHILLRFQINGGVKRGYLFHTPIVANKRQIGNMICTSLNPLRRIKTKKHLTREAPERRIKSLTKTQSGLSQPLFMRFFYAYFQAFTRLFYDEWRGLNTIPFEGIRPAVFERLVTLVALFEVTLSKLKLKGGQYHA